jgi:hypothetical protein
MLYGRLCIKVRVLTSAAAAVAGVGPRRWLAKDFDGEARVAPLSIVDYAKGVVSIDFYVLILLHKLQAPRVVQSIILVIVLTLETPNSRAVT